MNRAIQRATSAAANAVTVESKAIEPSALREAVEALCVELVELAFQHEKVLEKLDLRLAKRARRAAIDLKALVRAATESGVVNEPAVCKILDDCHKLLLSEAEPISARPPKSGRFLIASKPAPLKPMYTEDEPTMPGHRGAILSLVSLTASEAEDDEFEQTAAGLPQDVVANYLREVRAAAG